MTSRDRILARIRAAVATPSPAPAPPPPGALFAPIPETDLLARFEREFAALRGTLHRAAGWEEARRLVAGAARGRVALGPGDEVASATRGLALDAVGDVADADLGITGCDALVAATGSIVLTARSGGGRALSVLPPAHLVIARREQLVPHLADAFSVLRARHAPAWPTLMTVITGPSRTADIEKVLVLGAHGPRELFLILVD